MTEAHRNIIILGSGPAGCTAAVYAARAGVAPLLLHGDQPGGQLTMTTEVENFPGFSQAVMGPDLMQTMHTQAENSGAEIEYASIERVEFQSGKMHRLYSSDKEYTCDAVIIATGASAKWLGLESERAFLGFGVSSCATCDGHFFRNRPVCVVGGGNTALEEALYLAGLCSTVYLIHRRDTFRGENILQKRVFENPKIQLITNSRITEIIGEQSPKKVTGVKVVTTEGTESRLEVAAAFIAIGHSPNTGLFKGFLDIDAEGYILTRRGSTETSMPGVFAAGDVQDKIFRQAVTAAGSGCMAAIESKRYLDGIENR